ncbi:hypothetical protein NMG60_11004376 [Bertholletia excelsa]
MATEAISSYGTSWADQWDSDPDPIPVETRKTGGRRGIGMKAKVNEGLGKTKAVASTGVRKVKEGTSHGFHWIKDNSYGTSWADQWDSNPDPISVETGKTGGGDGGIGMKAKVSKGLGKTKAAASTGVRKVKEGTSHGFHWIKDKYRKTTQKH